MLEMYFNFFQKFNLTQNEIEKNICFDGTEKHFNEIDRI